MSYSGFLLVDSYCHPVYCTMSSRFMCKRYGVSKWAVS